MEERPIVRLSEELIGKIAAGEVVESPASAIKELVENSLDAGATCVTVEIRDGGIAYLRVTDNGRGIPSRDVRLAFERHATSKIRRTEDLFDLHTLGFRGEALASIAAVSKLTLTTRHAGEDAGTRAVNEGGVIRSITEAASPQGTTIVARDLFYNTPVRLKFLKKPVTEASKVAEVIARLILAHPDRSFRLVSNDKQIYASPGNGDLRSAVFCLYGREIASAMVPVRSEGAVSVTGLVGVGLQARSNRSRQTFIVNGRTIRSALLTQALEEACRERVTIGHYPICVLNIQMPNALVDVNVHPNKLEVRFSNEPLILQSVRGAVQDAFSVSPLASAPSLFSGEEDSGRGAPIGTVRVIDMDTREGVDAAKAENRQPPAGDAAKEQTPGCRVHVVPARTPGHRQEAGGQPETARPTAAQQAGFSGFVTRYFGDAVLRESAVPPNPPADGPIFGSLGGEKPALHSGKPAGQEDKAPAAQEGPRGTAPATAEPALGDGHGGPVCAERTKDQAPAEPVQESLLDGMAVTQDRNDPLYGYRMVGVAFDTYIMLQNEKQLLFIDQHAAHERILYERLMREIDRGAGSQVLMVPQVVHVTPQDRARIGQYAEEIRAAGFDVEPFGEDSYRIRAVPNVLGEPQTRGAFLDLVDHLGELRVLTTQQKRRDAILQMACKKAVKGGDKLTPEEIRPLLADMLATGAPPTCPHGRPLVVVLTRSELEKRFRRINH